MARATLAPARLSDTAAARCGDGVPPCELLVTCVAVEPATNPGPPRADQGLEAAIARLTRGQRVPELDGLRGIAILSVVVWHYVACVAQPRLGSLPSRALALLRLSWSGVDLFFVLSGFLIGGILIDARESPRYFSTFYARRFYRIFPLYYLYLALFGAAVLGGFGATSATAEQLVGDPLPLPVYALFAQNLVIARGVNFGPLAIGMTWSLAVEEQFYVVLPLLVRLLSPPRLVWTLVVIIGAAPVVRCVFYYGLHLPLAPYVLLPCRADALGLGALLALLLRDPTVLRRVALFLASRRLAAGIGVAAAAMLGLLVKENGGVGTALNAGIGATALAALYSLLLVYAISGRFPWLSQVLGARPLQTLGRLCYGIYIYHETVNALCHLLIRGDKRDCTSLAGIAVTSVSAGVTLLIAEISFRFFEAPLLRRGRAYSYGSAKSLQSSAGA